MARTTTARRPTPPKHPAPLTEPAAADDATGIDLRPWLIGFAVIELVMFASFGAINRDEGWYLLAAHNVFAGKLPYRDFNYFQAPVLPYLYGGPQWLFGQSIMVGRIESAALTLAALLALAAAASAIGGRRAATWTLGLLCLNPQLLYAGSVARSEAATTLLIALTVLCFLHCRRGWLALLLAPACLLLAAGTRSALLPAFVIATAYIWWCRPARGRDRMLAAGALAALAAIIAIPVLLSPPHVVVFDLWSSQIHRSTQWLPASVSAPYHIQARMLALSTVWSAFMALVPPVTLVLAFGVQSFRSGWRPQWRRPNDDPLTAYLVLGALAAMIFVPFVGAVPFEPRYFVPSSAILTVIVGAVASRGLGSPRDGAELIGSLFVTLVVVTAIVALPFMAVAAQASLSPRSVATQFRGAPAIIDAQMGHGDRLFTFDTTLALAAHRPLSPDLEMAQFSYWPRMSTAEARAHRVYDESLLEEAINTATPKVIALTDIDVTTVIEPSLRQPAATTPLIPPPEKALPHLVDHYRLAATIDHYGQFDDRLYIFVRKS